jgi:hypothetical protein
MIDQAPPPIPPEDRIEPESKKCSECDSPSIDFCKHCGQEFCIDHRSKYNPLLCHNCVNDSNLKLEVGSITDSDGTEHRGRQFKLIGEGWPRAVQKIHDLNEQELEAYITELKERLKEAQAKLDYTRILLAAAEYEKSHNEWSRSVAARKRRERIEQGAVNLNKKKFKMGPTAADKKEEMLAASLGITVEQFKQLKIALAGKKN